MNFSQLEYFVYAAELGSFALASKASFVNPSTISLAVSNLEKELGVKLLIRSSNGVTLTEAGSEFFDQSSAALNSIKNLKNFPQTRVAQENAGELILGIATDFWDGNVISDRVLNSFERAFPGIAVSIFNASSVECLKALNRSIVDTAVVVGAADEGKYDYTRLFGKKVSLLVGAENPLASEKEIRINDLFDVPIAMPSDIGYLYDKIVSLYAVHGRSPNFKFIPHDYEAIMDFFRSQRGVAFLVNAGKQVLLHRQLVMLPLCAEDAFSLPIFCVKRRKGTRKEADMFMKHVVDNFSKH